MSIRVKIRKKKKRKAYEANFFNIIIICDITK